MKILSGLALAAMLVLLLGLAGGLLFDVVYTDQRMYP